MLPVRDKTGNAYGTPVLLGGGVPEGQWLEETQVSSLLTRTPETTGGCPVASGPSKPLSQVVIALLPPAYPRERNARQTRVPALVPAGLGKGMEASTWSLREVIPCSAGQHLMASWGSPGLPGAPRLTSIAFPLQANPNLGDR